MPRLSALSVALLLVLPASAAAQQPASAPVRVTTSAVSRVTLYRITPGQNAANNQDVLDHLIPIYEEYKKAGIITGYGFFGKATSDGPDDWNFGVMLTYPNYAGLDNLGTRTDAITLKHYGSAEKRTAVGTGRNAFRTVVSSTLTTSLAYSR